VDWVTANAVHPAVANMSLGGGVSEALDAAVVKSASSGVFYAIAAGNSSTDACTSSPARTGRGDNGIMTTAAIDSSDSETSWSNYGACVDVWAPGQNILSTKRGGGTTTMSGTSMASPNVAGTAALALLKPKIAVVDASGLEIRLKSDLVNTSKFGKGSVLIMRVNADPY